MSLSCPEVRALFEPYAAETLSRQERGAVREHLTRCASCLREGSASDPGLLFARAAEETDGEVSPAEVARVVTAVRAGIALKVAEGRLSAGPSRRRAGAVASAAAIVALTLALPGSLARREPLPQPQPREARATAPGGAFLPVAYPPGQARVLGATSLEKKTPADATIYNWNPGGEEPRVVWIVDRSLDI